MACARRSPLSGLSNSLLTYAGRSWRAASGVLMETTAVWPYYLFLAGLLLGTVLAVAIIILGLRYRSRPRAAALICLMAAIAEWSSLYAVEMTVPGLALKVLMARLEYLGIVFVPVTWLVAGAVVAGHQAWATPRRLLLLAGLPVLTLLLVWTGDTHQLISTAFG